MTQHRYHKNRTLGARNLGKRAAVRFKTLKEHQHTRNYNGQPLQHTE
jgi:hypothetical protein